MDGYDWLKIIISIIILTIIINIAINLDDKYVDKSIKDYCKTDYEIIGHNEERVTINCDGERQSIPLNDKIKKEIGI